MYVITSKPYLKNDLNGEESSEDVICIAQDLKAQQEGLFVLCLVFITNKSPGVNRNIL